MIESDSAAVISNEELVNRIQILEKENRLLRQRLDEAGISYADIVEDNSEDPSALYDTDQGARIKRFEVTDKIASDFFMMFCRGRKDVYDLRYTNPKTGKNGYYTQVQIELSDRIYIDSSGMSNKIKRQLRRMATFSNKQYFQNQAMDMPNYDESRETLIN